MSGFPVTRAAHLIGFIDVLRDIGAPVARELARAKLPTLIEEQPGSYIAFYRAMDFLQSCTVLEKVDDLGYLAAQRSRLADLSPRVLGILSGSVTLYELLAAYVRYCRIEDSSLLSAIAEEGGYARVESSLRRIDGISNLQYSEWIQLIVPVNLVRRVLGPAWQPTEITFMSRFDPCDEAREDFGNTRILMGQDKTSFLIPLCDLGTPANRIPLPGPRREPVDEDPGICFDPLGTDELLLAETLQAVIRPYLPDGHLPINLAAEIAGTTVRTLQRNLATQGLSYSDLITHIRVDTAASLLRDPALRIIDIALEVGYDDPSHFSRAFRQVHGISPRAFRAGQSDTARSSLR